jgi:hypothetical protein
MDNKLLEKLVEQERDAMEKDFLAPVFYSTVKVRICGVIHEFKIKPATYRGFGIFRPLNYKEARYVRDANIGEKQAYLERFPALTFVVCSQERKTAILFIDDGRFKIKGEVPIALLEDAQLFDVIKVRFDGATFWYERHDGSTRVADELRLRINEKNPTIPPAYSEVYKIILADREKEFLASTEGRIKSHVNRADGKFLGYKERPDGYSIDYEVNGHKFTSTVDKNLRVVSAGICLTDHETGIKHDSDFDLQSLVTVIREGQNTRQIVRW